MIIIYPEYFEIPVTKSGKCSIFSSDIFISDFALRGEQEGAVSKNVKKSCDEFADIDEEYIENELLYSGKKE